MTMPWMMYTHRAKMPTDHHGSEPPIDSRAPIAPRLPPMMPSTRPNVLPAISEKPPASWITPRTIRTQPRVLRSSSMNLLSFTKMLASSRAPMPYMMLSVPAISSRIAANATLPTPRIRYLLELISRGSVSVDRCAMSTGWHRLDGMKSAMPDSELREALGDDDPPRCLDQCEVREGLREVAQMAAGAGVELLCVEAERRRGAEQPLHQVARALVLSDDGQRRHEPERADQEAALLA